MNDSVILGSLVTVAILGIFWIIGKAMQDPFGRKRKGGKALK